MQPKSQYSGPHYFLDLFDLFDENVNGTSDLNRGTYPTTLLAALSPTLKPENAPFSPTRCTRRHVCKSSGFPRCLIKACCSNQERMLSGCSANCPNQGRRFGGHSEKTRASMISYFFLTSFTAFMVALLLTVTRTSSELQSCESNSRQKQDKAMRR